MPGDGEFEPGHDSAWDFKSLKAGVSHPAKDNQCTKEL
jgi:hypothetical protein